MADVVVMADVTEGHQVLQAQEGEEERNSSED
jgi:hypothetical protein